MNQPMITVAVNRTLSIDESIQSIEKARDLLSNLNDSLGSTKYELEHELYSALLYLRALKSGVVTMPDYTQGGAEHDR